LLVGFRLLFNRPNRHGSALPPYGWLALGLLFCASFVFFCGLAVHSGQYAFLPAALPGLGLALHSFSAFRSARGHRGTAR
jgi:hypothetical protein